jgi:hypothetical protein
MSLPHTDEQKAPGKYDCHFDSYIHGQLLEFVDYFGEVNEYGVVTWKLDLNEDIVPEHELIEMMKHYGTPWLIIQEDDRGFVTVMAIVSESERDALYARFEASYNEWQNQEEEQ